MAHMILAAPVESAQSAAERDIFTIFRKRLGDDYTVFHSFTSLRPPKEN
jgi:hypothetical protein